MKPDAQASRPCAAMSGLYFFKERAAMTPCGDPLLYKSRTGDMLECCHKTKPGHNHKDVYGMSASDAVDGSPQRHRNVPIRDSDGPPASYILAFAERLLLAALG